MASPNVQISEYHFGGFAESAWAETSEAIPATIAKSENFMM